MGTDRPTIVVNWQWLASPLPISVELPLVCGFSFPAKTNALLRLPGCFLRPSKEE